MRHREKSFGVGRSEALENDLATSLIDSENTPAVTACEDPALVTVSLVGAPQGKGRARAFLRCGHAPAVTRSYEGMIRTAAMDAMGNRPPFDQPIEFVLRSVFPGPPSWSAKPRNQAIVSEIKPGKKPDLDNIAKAWRDALNRVVFRDDELIRRSVLEKTYGPQPHVVVMVRAAR
jgi:Holliday junction resolvase RusA-like endonuclease